MSAGIRTLPLDALRLSRTSSQAERLMAEAARLGVDTAAIRKSLAQKPPRKKLQPGGDT